jgi:predicted GNAT family acetyltransferase
LLEGKRDAMQITGTDSEVVHAPEASRYELWVDGRLVGVADYRIRDGRILFTHTEVERSLEQRGLGSRLVAAALEDAERQRLEVIPLCPFVAWYMERHQSPQ